MTVIFPSLSFGPCAKQAEFTQTHYYSNILRGSARKKQGCPSWEPLLLAVAAPGDAMRLALEFGVTNGAALSIYALSLR